MGASAFSLVISTTAKTDIVFGLIMCQDDDRLVL